MAIIRRMLLTTLIVMAGTSPVLAQKGPQGAKGPQPVIVVVAKKDRIEDRVEALGTLRANETVVLTSTVTEPVTAVNFEDGQRVQAGDILVEMMSTEESASLAGERATYEEARRQLERVQSLAKSGAVSKSVLDQRQREFETANARLDGIKSQISDRIITAPFAGVLGLRNISKGAVLQPGTKITTLDDDSVMKLDFSVPSVFLSALKPGLEIEAQSNAFEKQTFKGQISSIDSQIDPITRSVMVRAVLPNKEGLLKPGLLMSVEILKDPREAIVLPEEAIVPVGYTNHVFVVEEAEGKIIAKERDVTLGMRQPGMVEIIEGLKEGEQVVTHGTLNISDGAEVKINATQTGDENLPDLLKEQSTQAEGK